MLQISKQVGKGQTGLRHSVGQGKGRGGGGAAFSERGGTGKG